MAALGFFRPCRSRGVRRRRRGDLGYCPRARAVRTTSAAYSTLIGRHTRRAHGVYLVVPTSRTPLPSVSPAGRKIAAFSLTESASGRRRSVQTTAGPRRPLGAERHEDWSLNGPIAYVVCSTPRTIALKERAGGITAFIVDNVFKGIPRWQDDDKMTARIETGERSSRTASSRGDCCRRPARCSVRRSAR